MPRLSVIVPVYRTSATLGRCVESILRGGWDDMEVVLIDDGGTDTCPTLCDHWAAKDHRIAAIHKPNGGLSDARNAGLDRATGDCIAFVDSDDYILSGAFGRLMRLMELHPDWDILEFAIEREMPGGRIETYRPGSAEYTDTRDYWMQTEGYRHSYAWNKLWRRRLFQSVRFPKGKTFEDQWTTPLLLAQAGTVATTDCAAYRYTLNPDGITQRAAADDMQSLLEANIAAMLPYQAHPLYARYYACVLDIQLAAARYGIASQALATQARLPRHSETAKLSTLHIIKLSAARLLGIQRLCKIYTKAMGRL